MIAPEEVVFTLVFGIKPMKLKRHTIAKQYSMEYG